jgi:hypothetical protein
MGEKLINIDALQGRRGARRIVNAFIKEGIVGKEDEITVVLKPADPKITSHGKTTKVEVLTVFRDGDGVRGEMDAVTDTYRVELP